MRVTAMSHADKLLFTPGPLTTSSTVKQAMLRDLGSRDAEFLAVVSSLRARLLDLADVAEPEYSAIPIQGSGTYGVEAALGTVVPRNGKLLVLCNGAYGERLATIARTIGIAHTRLAFPEDQPVDCAAAAAALDADPELGHVAIVHCETSTGLLNPVAELAQLTSSRGRTLIVDAMSSFGALPLALGRLGIDVLITSANKCLEGIPGCALVLARRALIEAASGNARSLSLDLSAQLRGLDKDGQFRFTPPTHVLLALVQALDELDAEGGIRGRGLRYSANQRTLLAGMQQLGFRTYLPATRLSPIITSFLMPTHPRWHFPEFYRELAARGFVIYPGKVSQADCFRIGTIGRIQPEEIEILLAAIAEVLADMGVQLT